MKWIVNFWRRRSLRFWLATGMLVAIVPLAVSAGTEYVLYRHQIIQPLTKIAAEHRFVLHPLRSLQFALWNIASSVDEYVVDGSTSRAVQTRHSILQIDQAFQELKNAYKDNEIEVGPLRKANDDWKEILKLSHSILSTAPSPQDPSTIKNIENFQDDTRDLAYQLQTIYEDLAVENARLHDQVISTLYYSEYVVIIAFGASLVLIFLGVMVINHSLVSSTDLLAEGALRLAMGDREYRVKVHIPPELANVANAFNTMTAKILEQEAALRRAAATDGLTGLLNRSEFDRLLAEEIKRGERYGNPASLIMIDIDHFKKFNDTFGHQGGDETLRTVARTVGESVRDVDNVCRFGGEEIAVILPATDAASAQHTAERIRATVAERDIHLESGQTAKVTISLGVATYPTCGSTPESLLKTADAALYRSKEQGRDRVTVATGTS